MQRARRQAASEASRDVSRLTARMARRVRLTRAQRVHPGARRMDPKRIDSTRRYDSMSGAHSTLRGAPGIEFPIGVYVRVTEEVYCPRHFAS